MKVWLWVSLALCGASAQAADIYKCINPVTRDVTYANSPCPKGEEQSKPELIENQIKFTHVEPKPKIERLPANQQEVVRLKFQNGFSYKEISRITTLSVGNVGFLIHTAVARLRADFAAQRP